MWREQINGFLSEKLKIQLHPQKSRIIPLSRSIDFVGFRNFYHHKLLRKRNISGMKRKIISFEKDKVGFGDIIESYRGWQAYAMWANTNKLREKIKKEIIELILKKFNED
ncbi:hypothetical protein HYV50_01820 [Candidatus Pacearchaeota archaeon]|nr:hypothetical protein [Candidatus Pacearchaeota archaeon]